MLTVHNTEAIRRIEEAIGYTFHDKRLLVQVLTRKTYLKIDPEAPDNEVLEFYGDTLMNYHVTNYFMSKYAHMLDDGLFFMRTVEQFTDMRSHYVCNRYLTDRVKALGLARYMRAQNREAELRRDGEKAYADVFESLVGAIYLDSYQNDNLIRAFILRQLGIEPKRLPADVESFDYDTLSTPIPSLSDYQSPAAEETDAEVEISVEAITDMPTVEAVHEITPVEIASIEAEAASEAMISEDRPAVELTAEAPAAEPVPAPKQEALAALCNALGYELPTYGETPPNAPNARPVAACTLKYKDAKGKLVKISLNDSGRTLAEATEKAAAKMMKRLEKQVADAAARDAKAEEKAEESVTPATEDVSADNLPALEVTPVPEIPQIIDEKAHEDSAEAQASEVQSAADQPVAEIVSAEEPSMTVTEPVAETAAEESVVPTAETVSTEEAKTNPPPTSIKEKKAPARKSSSKSRKSDKPADAASAEAVSEAAPELTVQAEPTAEASPEEVKTSHTKKASGKKKAASSNDDTDEAVATQDTVNSSEEIPAKEAKPAKKRSSSRKKQASEKQKQTEATDTQAE